MIRKIPLIAFLLLMVSSTYTLAEEKGPGCGLGKQLFAGQTGLVPHLLAATINHSATQTASITTGTSGCDESSVIQREHEAEVFVATNIAPLTLEMAQGSGERLNVLAGLMGCPTAARGAFSAMTQARFEVLPLAEGDSPVVLVEALRQEVKGDATLAASCTPVS